MRIEAVLGLAVALAMAGSARADIVIDFAGLGLDTGTVKYLGGATSLIGAGIEIGTVTGAGVPTNDGITDAITGGVLSFTTGALSSYSAGVYLFGPGGTITVTGSGPGCTTVGGCAAHAGNIASGPTLMTGSLVSATFIGNSIKLVLANGADTKDPYLVQYFGLRPGATTWEFSGTVHTTTAVIDSATTHAFHTTAGHSTDISNSATVPDGGVTLMLLGSALVGLETLRRKVRA